jgi:hypothetical protein
VWGGDALTEFGKTFWTVNLDNGLRMLKQGQPYQEEVRKGTKSAMSDFIPTGSPAL